MIFDQISGLTGVARFDVEVEAWLNSQGFTIRRNVLSDVLEFHEKGARIPFTDDLLAEARFSLVYSRNGREPSKEKLADAISLIGQRNAYHPVQDYLKQLSWDGKKRIDTWLIEFAGAKDNSLVRAFSRKILCAAVRRALEPGCKFDHVLVLQGGQGLGKSRLVKSLCQDPSWFTDQVRIGSDAKETIERTSGAWVVEIAELAGLSRREADLVKQFITTTEDRARLAYARYAVTQPRKFVLIGTTNESSFLADMTGNRRWWLVKVAKCDIAGLESARDQLWAEAFQFYKSENLWLDDEVLQLEAEALGVDAADNGPWFEVLAELIPSGPLKITVSDTWKLLGIDSDTITRMKPTDKSNLKRGMVGLGFSSDLRNLRNSDSKQVKTFVRGNLDEAQWWKMSATRLRDATSEW